MEQAITTTLRLQRTWESAYYGFIVFDYSDHMNSVGVCQKHWNELCAYRRKVRLQKLNPLYTLEWNRISQTKIRRVGLTSFTMTRQVSHLVENRQKGLSKKLPWNRLHLPTSLNEFKLCQT